MNARTFCPSLSSRFPEGEVEQVETMNATGVDAARMEAFSDGVIAIIVTIMVLELRPPDSASLTALAPLWPIFAAYGLSFTLVAIYWVNHHNLLHSARRVGTSTLWLNIHFLFWLSLFPFAAAFIGQGRAAPLTIAVYAGVSAMTSAAFMWLNRDLTGHNQEVEHVRRLARPRRLKNLLALAANGLAIPMAFVFEPLAVALLAAPAAAYLLPLGAPGEPHPAAGPRVT